MHPTAEQPGSPLPRRVLVVGIGNILLRDEGVGVRVIEAMRGTALPDDVELLDGGTSGADLIDFIADRQKVIVIDAVRTDGPPGSVYRFGPEDLMQDAAPALSLHQLGLLETLRMARHMNCSPGEVVIFGVKPGAIDYGTDLTPQVAFAVPKVVQLVLTEAAR